MANSPQFAVFNGHINDSDARARQHLGRMFPAWLRRIEEIEAEHGGIMGVFHVSPEPATGAYVALVTAFSNEVPRG